MTTELIVKTSTTNASLDLMDDVPVSLNFAIADIKDPSKRDGAFSKTVKLPGSDINNVFFEHIFDVNIATNAFNPNVRTECWVLQDSIEVFRGYLRLREINVELVNDTQKVTYDVNLLGDNRSLFGAIGDSKLQDLTWSDLDHVYSKANQIASWTSTVGDNYIYPLIDYGYNNFLTNLFDVNQIRPAVYVKEYIDRIFAAAGKTYTSSFFNSTWFKRWFVPHNGDKFTMSAANLALREFYAGMTAVGSVSSFQLYKAVTKWSITNSPSSISSTTINDSNALVLNTNDTTSPFVDTGGMYSTSTGVFIIQDNGNYIINGSLNGQMKVTPPSGTTTILGGDSSSPFQGYVKLLYSINAGATWLLAEAYTMSIVLPTDITSSYQSFSHNINFSPKNFNAGVWCKVEFYPITGSAGVIFTGGSGTASIEWRLSSTSTLKCKLSTNEIKEGQTLTFSDAIPRDIKQKDFLMSIIKLGNLYVDVDPNDANNYIIEPRDDYYSSGVTKDWTSKLAVNQNFNIKLMPEIDIKNFIWTYKGDTDYYNKRYEDENGEVYGTYKKVITNDFSDKTEKNEVIFSPTPVVSNTNNSMILPKIFSYDGTSVKPMKHNIRILAYNGVQNVLGGTWSYTSTVSTSIMTTYPSSAMVDDPLNPTQSLEFGVPNEVFYDTATYTTNNIYNSKYSKFITEITDRDSRIVTAYFYLTPLDIAQFDFRDKIYVKDTLYFVNKISDYNKIKPGLTKVELLKIKTASAYTPTSESSSSIRTNNTSEGMLLRTFGMSPYDTNSGAGDNVLLGSNNRSSSTGSFISGENNTVTSGTSRVTILTTRDSVVMPNSDGINLIGCSGVSVGYGCSGITLMNCEGLTIADFVYDYTGIGVENKTITTASSGLIELGDSVGNPTEVTQTKTASFSVSTNVSTYFIDADHGANITALFNSAMAGKTVTFIRTDSSANLFYITNTGNTATLQGTACPVDLGMVQWDSITIHYDGTNFYIK